MFQTPARESSESEDRTRVTPVLARQAPRHASALAWVRSIRNLHHQRLQGNGRIRSGPKAVAFDDVTEAFTTRKGKPLNMRQGTKGKTHSRRGALTRIARRQSGSFIRPAIGGPRDALAPFPPAGPALRALASKCDASPRDPGLPSRHEPGRVFEPTERKAKPLRSASSGGVRMDGCSGSLMPNRSHEPGVHRRMAAGHSRAR